MSAWFERKTTGRGEKQVLFQYAEALDVLYAEPEDDPNTSSIGLDLGSSHM